MSPADPTQVTPRLLREWPLPEAGSSKYLRGRVLVIGGAVRTPGAVQLAGIAALRSAPAISASRWPSPPPSLWPWLHPSRA